MNGGLNGCKLPKTFRQSHPELPERLYPIFRDRDELASGSELSESIRKAMEDSDALIVICSPAARASLWVNEEIKRFKASGRGNRIFCFLVSGKPDANSPECAFPAAILQDEHGYVVHEPLAADATPQGDGKRNAMLKIAAGLLGVGVDDLKQRDAQRQARFWSYIALGTTLIAALTIGLAIYAFNAKKESELARKESELRRSQAEGLIGFMLGDLRKKLEPIGKLEILDAVGEQAMSYFTTLGNRGTQKELLSRAVALKQIGDVRFNQGKLEPALKAFQQSLLQSEALYKSNPNNNDYLFELGQAEFWVGYVAWERGDLDQAAVSMQRYMQYSKQLSERAPKNADYRMELSYAYSNLGSIAYARGESDTALENFALSRNLTQEVLASQPGDMALIILLAETWSWIGSAKGSQGDLSGSDEAYSEIPKLLHSLYGKEANAKATFTMASNLSLQADAKLALGDTKSAKDLNEKSLSMLAVLIASDPQNANWLQVRNKAEYAKLSMIQHSDWSPSETAKLDKLLESTKNLSEKDPSSATNKTYLANVMHEKALRALYAGNINAALEAAQSAHAIMLGLFKESKQSPQLLVDFALSAERLGLVLKANQDAKAAEQVWKDAAALLDKQIIRIFDFYPVRRLLAIDMQHTEKTKEIEKQLLERGYKNPFMDPAHTLSGSF
jgi:eukaryotic-like serine/threonine-protein kinase